MRCKACDYPLWGIQPGPCPECGTPFKPSDYEFHPNAVKFRCPDCGQTYYGTSEVGHLVPSEFDCVNCGRHLLMDEMVAEPADGVNELRTTKELHPWLDRKRIGFWASRFKTLFYALIFPKRLIKLTPTESSWFSAIKYGTMWLSICYALSLGFLVVAFSLGFLSSTGSTMVFGLIAGLVGGILGVILACLVYLLIWGLSAHAILKISGGTQHTLRRTMQAIGYAAPGHILAAIPCLGAYAIPVAWIWATVSAAIMLAVGQRVHWVRAAVAATIFPLALIGGTSAFVIWGFIATINAASNWNVTYLQTQLAPMANQLVATQPWPEHSIDLIDNTTVFTHSFVTALSHTDLQDVPLTPNANLMDYTTSSSLGQSNIRSAMPAIPPDTIAHRFGDYVFLYHGIDRATADPNLWLFVEWHDPDAFARFSWHQNSPMTSNAIGVAKLDGTIEAFTNINDPLWQQAITDQNALRAAANLPPLPDFDQVTHANPALTPAPSPAPIPTP